jgi:threonylcarbamoyladenosine tRNA methylthiotransferase MtaB
VNAVSKPTEIITFGCRVNTYESEVMRGHARAAGLEDAIIVNTCAVTAEAERQARQAIRRARRENPQARIIVTGCAAQVEPAKYAGMAEVDRVLGNMEKMDPASFLPEAAEPVVVSDIMQVEETASHLIEGFEERTRAFIQIQTGCDHRCTFCIIPFGRGNNRSVPMGEIVRQVRLLVENEVPEVVLTGVDITDYGRDLPGKPTLGQLCRRLLINVPDLKRLRLSSVDPVEVDEDLLRLFGEEERLMPHLHLSMQAGADLILKRMKRRHLQKDIYSVVERVRAMRPDVVFGADIIAGFPTETEALFAESLKVVEDCDLTWLHVFPYSERPGTPAARMPQVAKAERKERAQRLRALGEAQVARFLESRLGKSAQVLIEKEGMGRSEHFAPVTLFGPVGAILEARLIGLEGERLIAEAA